VCSKCTRGGRISCSKETRYVNLYIAERLKVFLAVSSKAVCHFAILFCHITNLQKQAGSICVCLPVDKCSLFTISSSRPK